MKGTTKTNPLLTISNDEETSEVLKSEPSFVNDTENVSNPSKSKKSAVNNRAQIPVS